MNCGASKYPDAEKKKGKKPGKVNTFNSQEGSHVRYSDVQRNSQDISGNAFKQQFIKSLV